MKKEINIGLLGFGTVGSGVAMVLKENAHEITQKVGAQLKLKKVLVRDVNKKRPYLEDIHLTENVEDIIEDKDIDIVIELMGGINPAKEYMLRAISNGKSVVTANKDVVAAYGSELFNAAEKNNVDIRYEASVGGGIPIITPLKQCLTGNRISEVMGIVNGTTNYMLTKMTKEGSDYDTVLKQAQDKGYAEANPAADVEGMDAARKAAILASIAFNTKVPLEKVSVEGITNITQSDIEYAAQLGYVVKLLAIARDIPEKGINVRVHPSFLPTEHPLSNVNDVFNAIFIRGNAIGEAMFYGQGAGSLPTASAVMADVIEVAREIEQGSFTGLINTCYEDKSFCPLEDTESSYYVRLLVEDKPGVLGSIATAVGTDGVSLKSVIQTRQVNDRAEIVAITHCVQHKYIQKATETLNALPVVSKVENIIRVEKVQGDS